MKATIGLEIGVPYEISLNGVFSFAFKYHQVSQWPWVAKITGRHPTMHWEREFLDGNVDYSCASRKGAKKWFILEPGFYQIREVHPRCKKEWRSFIEVAQDGTWATIDEARLNEVFGVCHAQV